MPIPLKTGEVLRGRYKIRRIIGQGGMGSIYLADDLRLEGRLCALKEVENDRTLPFWRAWIILTSLKCLISSQLGVATTW
jgi:hypothetical protein